MAVVLAARVGVQPQEKLPQPPTAGKLGKATCSAMCTVVDCTDAVTSNLELSYNCNTQHSLLGSITVNTCHNVCSRTHNKVATCKAHVTGLQSRLMLNAFHYSHLASSHKVLV